MLFRIEFLRLNRGLDRLTKPVYHHSRRYLKQKRDDIGDSVCLPVLPIVLTDQPDQLRQTLGH